MTGLDASHLVAMGQVAYWAARAERTLALVVISLISTQSETGVTVTNGMSFGSLLDLGKRLSEERPNDDQARAVYRTLAPRLRSAMEQRNHLLHGEWTRPRSGLPASVRLTRASGRKERDYSVDQIEDVAYDLADVTHRLFLLVLVIDGNVDYDTFGENYIPREGAVQNWHAAIGGSSRTNGVSVVQSSRPVTGPPYCWPHFSRIAASTTLRIVPSPASTAASTRSWTSSASRVLNGTVTSRRGRPRREAGAVAFAAAVVGVRVGVGIGVGVGAGSICR
jgi:hypothetical protein